MHEHTIGIIQKHNTINGRIVIKPLQGPKCPIAVFCFQTVSIIIVAQ